MFHWQVVISLELLILFIEWDEFRIEPEHIFLMHPIPLVTPLDLLLPPPFPVTVPPFPYILMIPPYRFRERLPCDLPLWRTDHFLHLFWHSNYPWGELPLRRSVSEYRTMLWVSGGTQLFKDLMDVCMPFDQVSYIEGRGVWLGEGWKGRWDWLDRSWWKNRLAVIFCEQGMFHKRAYRTSRGTFKFLVFWACLLTW
jgi:hypothetical protein